MANELELVLDAYGKVAAKRIIDDVPMLIHRMCKDVLLRLEKALEFPSDEDLREQMVEGCNIVSRRSAALKKLETMKAAEQCFRRMSMAM